MPLIPRNWTEWNSPLVMDNVDDSDDDGENVEEWWYLYMHLKCLVLSCPKDDSWIYVGWDYAPLCFADGESETGGVAILKSMVKKQEFRFPIIICSSMIEIQMHKCRQTCSPCSSSSRRRMWNLAGRLQEETAQILGQGWEQRNEATKHWERNRTWIWPWKIVMG